MTDRGKEQVVAEALATSNGKRMLREAIEKAGAKAADEFPPGSVGEKLARELAGLP